MHIPTQYATKAVSAITTLVLYSAILVNPTHAGAQMAMPSSQPTQAQPVAAAQAQDMQAQITQLKQQVAQLQAALQQNKTKKPASPKGSMGAAKPAMGMEDDSGEMGGMSSGAAKTPMAPMKDDGGEMSAMAPPGGAMKSGDAKPMGGSGCCGMSMGKPMPKAGGMADDKMTGMPSKSAKAMSGATTEVPHLLHVGANDFFLDHAQHLGLTSEQKSGLENIKSNAMRQKVASQKMIDLEQQELWQLTSADQPNSAQIDRKVQEIAKLNGDQQIAFIHSVTEAAGLLNDEQKAAAVKSMSPGTKMKPSAPMKKMPM